MPVIASQFDPPVLIRNGHVQTILPVLFPRRFKLVFNRTRLELEDGDFLDLDWARGNEPRSRLAILSHGLEGGTNNGYIRGMATALNAAGWDALAWNLRGCSGEANRLPRFYHSGETGDLAKVIAHAKPAYSKIALLGFSLGGNITLKYLGEAPVDPIVVGGVGVSVPVDLAASARTLDQRWSNKIYLGRFIKTMVAKIEAKAVRFPLGLDKTTLRSVKNFRQFDDLYTAPIHGFRDAADYWAKSSARQFLPGITVPTLLVTACNDPFLSPESFPFAEAEANPKFYFEAPQSGGHVGFLDLAPGNQTWVERRAVQFLAELT
ncbi:MAG: Alpha/beta hydrolase fold protein [Chthoniobacteraceae bacterium]|nr:Alpha/beta hydrolase fold protein [Chthoniobacteraceae bacterium]